MHATHRKARHRQRQESCSSTAFKATCMNRNTLRIASNDADFSAHATSTRSTEMHAPHMASTQKTAGNKQPKKFALHVAFSRRTNLFARTLRKLPALLATKSSGVSMHAHSTHASLRLSAHKVRPRKTRTVAGAGLCGSTPQVTVSARRYRAVQRNRRVSTTRPVDQHRPAQSRTTSHHHRHPR